MSTWLDVITDALIEIGAYGPADSIDPAEIQLAIRKVNRIVDDWSARRLYAYASVFTQFTLTPGHAPHLIGPGLASPDFALAIRPVRIDSAALILTDQTPNVDVPMNIRDAAWWAGQRVKSLTSDIPTDLFYEPAFPNGQLNFWPVPNYAYAVRLESWVALTSVPLDSNGNPQPTNTFAGPPGYENAMLLTLAEQLCTPYGRPLPPELAGRAAHARATIGSNNAPSKRTSSADYGTQGKRSRGDKNFNYYTGGPA